MSRQLPAALPVSIPRSARIAIAAARFNAPIVDRLLADCIARLEQNGVPAGHISVQRVPGSFELPVTCKAFCATKNYAAVIAIGAIVRGETPHFDLVANHTAAGLQAVSLELSIPVIFGVLATNTEKQAWARTHGPHSHAGISAADAACEMIAVLKAIPKGLDANGARMGWPSIKKRDTF
jgi:6,7-dimethyl-8-ribityllumazine synthase